MPAVVALMLTLALTPTPSPSPSATPGPVSELLGGVGKIVDDLLGGGSSTPSTSPTPRPTPSPPPAADPSVPAVPAPALTPAGSSAGSRPPGASAAPDRTSGGRGDRAAAVPLPNGEGAAPPTLASPTRGGWPLVPAYYFLVAGVLAVLALMLLLRRRTAGTPGVAGAPAPAPTPASAPDPGPVPDNISRLPTNLNAIYELGRLDERLDQDRGRRP
ncbi:hypothetical protein OG470_29010 [Micromonospora sp. NBC_00389]|uniref:hypothetical protein n=1 Tax=Micromonospora sp. NBC_00389 TaxID=2903586 RepID=UPI002E1F9117